MFNFLASIIVFTANILGSFQDPFEFDGDYGPEMNPTRNRVFELVIPRQEPVVTFSELIPPELASKIEDPSIASFIEKHGDENAFPILRNCPQNLLKIDQILRFGAASKGQLLELSILSSAYPLHGSSPTELKQRLMEQLFTDEIRTLIVPTEVSDKRYEIFQTSEGQIAFYWLYQSLNLHLVSQDQQMIEEINKTKSIFLNTIGDPQIRAAVFKEKIAASGAEVLFTQESDPFFIESLTADGLFLPPEGQNPQDGTLVFLRKGIWEEEVELVPLEGYPGYQKGRVNLLVATHQATNEKFLLASCHGHSTKPADARLQVEKILEKFDELSAKYPNLQLVIGIDANTKSEEDIEDFLEHLDRLGLVATEVGPTTVKKRMITVQHGKSGRVAVDQEDYLITLKGERGGNYHLSNPTVGFQNGPVDLGQPLPNLQNLSDHYPVGAVLTSKINFQGNAESILDETLHFINTHSLKDVSVKEIRARDAQKVKEVSGQELEIIKVVPITSFQGAKILVEEGYKPLILDMANATSPGGSVEIGNIAQEETLCLQSNLLLGLKTADSMGYYPIHEHGGILIRNVLFFLDDRFDFLDEPFIADVFAIAAYDCNTSHEEDPAKRLRGYDRPLNDDAYLLGTKAKMRAMFISAIENQNDSLVLSAMGCGAFKNDPQLMAILFKDVLSEEAFKGKFKRILFAIPDEKGANHQIFAEIFNEF